jgi:hypothetical protein
MRKTSERRSEEERLYTTTGGEKQNMKAETETEVVLLSERS